jgi:hypothetical protein
MECGTGPGTDRAVNGGRRWHRNSFEGNAGRGLAASPVWAIRVLKTLTRKITPWGVSAGAAHPYRDTQP